MRLARLLHEHGRNVTAFAITAERVAAKEMDAALYGELA